MRLSVIVDVAYRLAEQLWALTEACFARSASHDAGLEEPSTVAQRLQAFCGALTPAVAVCTLLAVASAGLAASAIQRPRRGPVSPRHSARGPAIPASAFLHRPLSSSASAAHSSLAASAESAPATAAAVAASTRSSSATTVAAPAAAPAVAARHELPAGLLTRRYCQARLGMKSFSGLWGGLAAAAGVAGSGGVTAKEAHKAQARAREKLKGYHELAKVKR